MERICQTLTVTTNHAITTICLNRPDKKNAMNFVMMRELLAVAHALKARQDIQAVIITGADKDFCAGLDLADLNHKKNLSFALWELAKPSRSLFQAVCLVWRDLPMPVIAVIEGVCLGAGLQLALGADIRIATPQARLAILEAKWGLVADMGLSVLAQGIAPDVIKELAMSARMIDGKQARHLGLVSHVNETPMAHAQALAEEFATRSPDACLAVKRLINNMYPTSAWRLYQEKYWQIKLLLGQNRKIAIKKVKDHAQNFVKRQFR